MSTKTHRTGETWLDTSGTPIQTHGGGVLLHDGIYYWYGENRAGRVRELPDGKRRADAVGVSCYRSSDLIAWEDLGVVLPAVVDDPNHDLHITKVIERPKVIFNPSTRKFVMWLHVDSPDYKAARAGVAVADDPAGPFQYLQSHRPNDFETRDQTVFQDDDGRAYHFAASDGNRNTMISLLSDDYLRPSGKFAKRFTDRYMEAYAICERDGRYWLIASGCSGWKPNEARSAVADDLLGEWTELGNPCVGENAAMTFGGQSAFVIPASNASNQSHIAMFDIWRPDNLRTSGYMWLPIEWTGDDRMSIRWHETWPPAPARNTLE